MGLDGMGWDGMGWDGMGWDGMGWDGMMDSTYIPKPWIVILGSISGHLPTLSCDLPELNLKGVKFLGVEKYYLISNSQHLT
jgi:hypothetical protein